jgi:hypothetical protein
MIDPLNVQHVAGGVQSCALVSLSGELACGLSRHSRGDRSHEGTVVLKGMSGTGCGRCQQKVGLEPAVQFGIGTPAITVCRPSASPFTSSAFFFNHSTSAQACRHSRYSRTWGFHGRRRYHEFVALLASGPCSMLCDVALRSRQLQLGY